MRDLRDSKLILLDEGKGDIDYLSSYIPLSILDTAGKILEAMIRPLLTDAIESSGVLSTNQLSLSKSRFTLGAIQ